MLEKFLDNSLNTNGFDNSGSSIIDNPSPDNDTALPGNNVNTTLEKNQIIDYDKEFKITFGVPNGYKSDRISESYHTLTKGDISVTITVEHNVENEYYNTLVKSKEYLETQSNYRNVNLSTPKTTTIDGKTFYKTSLEYESVYGSSSLKIAKDYIWCKLSDKKVVKFEIYNLDKMTSAELQEMLTINVEK